MLESDLTKILSTVRRKVGLSDQIRDFDEALILETNTAFSILSQLGVGPKKGFHITGEDETWSDFFGKSDDPRHEMARNYVCQRVRLKFDPPQVSYLLAALESDVAELEWRLSIPSK